MPAPPKTSAAKVLQYAYTLYPFFRNPQGPDTSFVPPAVRGARTLADDDAAGHETEACVYRLGGNSCLSGDFMGYWQFDAPHGPGGRGTGRW